MMKKFVVFLVLLFSSVFVQGMVESQKIEEMKTEQTRGSLP